MEVGIIALGILIYALWVVVCIKGIDLFWALYCREAEKHHD
jgi:hypothetical protein